jgi:hypothetical protein
MKKLAAPLALAVLLVLGRAQEPYQPSERERLEIQTKLSALAGEIRSLRAAGADDDLLVDVEVCQRAVENALRFPQEITHRGHIENTITTLDRGLDRARQLKEGKPTWPAQKGRVSRAVRSRIDGVPQPYRVVIPDTYDPSRPMPLYIYLHGRSNDYEINYLAASRRANVPSSPTSYIRLEPFGRSYNGFHWAGETDVFEAIASVRKRYNIDPDRIVLRGFSMGGVGAWHIGLHHPGEFAALEAGAGNTRSYRHRFLANLGPVQQATMKIYESMMDYALNVANLPVAAYGGEADPQLQASVNVRQQLEREGFSFERQGNVWKAPGLPAIFVMGPRTGHSMHPESRAQIDAFLADAAARGRTVPSRIRFVTYTTRYNRSHWLTIAGMQQHYQRAEVDARRDDEAANYVIKTRNVSRLLLTDTGGARKITIDGDTFPVRPQPRTFLEYRAGHWRPAPPSPELRKRHGLQGPIDDAFLEPFLCVRPTGQPLNPVAAEHARREIERFSHTFAVTASDIATHNLILFGDPGSNRLIAKALPKLPLRWTKESVGFGDKLYSAADHVPALIYPNPLNPRRYLVLNTGHTADERDYRFDYLLPRFGDYAILKTGKQSVEIAETGLFNESWKLP